MSIGFPPAIVSYLESALGLRWYAQVTKKVVLDLQDAQVERPTINMIQSLVENRLMEAGFINIAEHYISYRLQRDLERNGYGDKVIVHLRFEQTK